MAPAVVGWLYWYLWVIVVRGSHARAKIIQIGGMAIYSAEDRPRFDENQDRVNLMSAAFVWEFEFGSPRSRSAAIWFRRHSRLSFEFG